MDAFRKPRGGARQRRRAARTRSPDAVEHALTAEKPRTRYLVGRDAKLRARALERLPRTGFRDSVPSAPLLVSAASALYSFPTLRETKELP